MACPFVPSGRVLRYIFYLAALHKRMPLHPLTRADAFKREHTLYIGVKFQQSFNRTIEPSNNPAFQEVVSRA